MHEAAEVWKGRLILWVQGSRPAGLHFHKALSKVALPLMGQTTHRVARPEAPGFIMWENESGLQQQMNALLSVVYPAIC